MSSNELKHFYADHGICQDCGHEFAEPGHVRCKACAELFNKRKKQRDPDGGKHRQYLQDLREYRRANGLCLDCNRPAVPGRKKCAIHLEMARQAMQVRRIKKRVRKQAILDGIILGG